MIANTPPAPYYAVIFTSLRTEGDNGYGDMEDGYSQDPAEVGRLACELVDVGAVGINLEDGSDAPALLAEKIRAIRAALKGRPLFINARTDVYLRQLKVEGAPAQASIARLKLYQQAGADGAFVPGLTALSEVTEISSGVAMCTWNWLRASSRSRTERLA